MHSLINKTVVILKTAHRDMTVLDYIMIHPYCFDNKILAKGYLIKVHS